MSNPLIKYAKAILPESVFNKTKEFILNRKFQQAFHRWRASEEENEFLSEEVLYYLARNYKFESYYDYDAESLMKRGVERAEELFTYLPADHSDFVRFLELGCGDGMVSSALQKKGKEATAVDFSDSFFDERAKQAGVRLIKADAASMPFENGSFDVIFSYNAFEHFPDPGKVYNECVRLLRKGGYLVMIFQPIYYAPYGMHFYKHVPIPYSQFLFEESLLKKYIADNKLPEFNFETFLNKWSIDNFRDLWRKYDSDMLRIQYEEIKDYSALDLVINYPGCFKGKSNNFENFVIAGIHAVFVKK